MTPILLKVSKLTQARALFINAAEPGGNGGNDYHAQNKTLYG